MFSGRFISQQRITLAGGDKIIPNELQVAERMNTYFPMIEHLDI